MSALRKYISSPFTKMAAIEIAYSTREEFCIHITVCSKKNNTLQFEEQFQNLSFEKALPLMKKIERFYLIITGKIILQKNLGNSSGQPITSINEIVPESMNKDFSYQVYEYNQKQFCSIIRNETLERVLTQLNKEKLLPEQIYLGSFPCLIFSKIIENTHFVLRTSNTTIHFENEDADFFFENNEFQENYTIGKDNLNACNVPGTCVCFNSIVQLVTYSTIENEFAQQLIKEAKEKRKFKKKLIGLTTLTALIVTINYLMNIYYSAEHSTLDEQLSLNRITLNEIQQLENKVNEKKLLIGKRELSNGPVISLLADQLGIDLPSDIRLINLEVFPLSNKIQKEKPMTFEYNKIVTEGFAQNAKDLDHWIETCKSYSWIKDVSLIKYDYDTYTKKGTFKLELHL